MMATSLDTKTSKNHEAQQLQLPRQASSNANLPHLQVRRHRRSISQLMASMGNF